MPVDPRIQRTLDGPLTTPTDLRFAPKKGHVAPPGTGPIGETCASCRHDVPTSCDRREWVCDLDRSRPKVAIKGYVKACARWEARGR